MLIQQLTRVIWPFSLLNDKILGQIWSGFKVLAESEDKINSKIEICFWMVEKGEKRPLQEKRENAGLPAFSPFPKMFSKSLFLSGSLKLRLCVKKLSLYPETKL